MYVYVDNKCTCIYIYIHMYISVQGTLVMMAQLSLGSRITHTKALASERHEAGILKSQVQLAPFMNDTSLSRLHD